MTQQWPHPPPPGHGPVRPGSKAWVEQHHGRVAEFSERILPGIVDALITLVAVLLPCIIGGVLIAVGVPDSHDCGPYGMRTCDIPGTGSGVLIALGVLMFLLALVLGFAAVAWNRVWRVHRTGQSVGKALFHLRTIDATTGANPQLGFAALRELVAQFAGIISWIWMLVDHDDRTLGDIVGRTHVIHVPRV